MTRLLALGFVLLVGVNDGRAQGVQGSQEFSVERFQLAMDSAGLLNTEWSDVPEHMALDFALVVGFADDPLVGTVSIDGGPAMRYGSVVSHRLGGNLVAALGLWERLQIGIDLPLILSQDQDPFFEMSSGSIDRFGTGDLRVLAKVELLNAARHPVGIALLPTVTLPTHSSGDFFGEDGVRFVPQLVVSGSYGPVRLSVNGGYHIRDDVAFENLTVDDEITLRSALGFRFEDLGGPPIGLDFSYSAATVARDPFAASNTDHGELLGGANYRINKNWIGFAGSGVGLNEGFGTPDWRVFAGLRWQRSQEPERPPLPPPDRDPDFILARDELCTASGDPDLQVAAGCLPPDRDKDGIPDRLDNCPDEAGPPENNGCKMEQRVKITTAQVEILDAVHFETDKDVILPVSFPVLNDVARVLAAHETIRVRVEGHTDSRAKDDYNMDLSQRRANSVKRYLVTAGIAEDRLEALGYGETKPIAKNDTTRGRAANRRVVFTILETPIQVDTKDTGPKQDTIKD